MEHQRQQQQQQLTRLGLGWLLTVQQRPQQAQQQQ
jgi:hypothetical protein